MLWLGPYGCRVAFQTNSCQTIQGGQGAQGGLILGIYYGVTRSERYGALVGQSEDWTTFQVYIHGMDGIDWNTSRLLRAQ